MKVAENTDFLKPNQELARTYNIESRPFAKGYIAQVRRITNKVNGNIYAAKYSPRFRAGNEIYVGLHEMCILNLISSKGCQTIIQFIEGYITEFYYVCVTELAVGGDLQSLIDMDIVLLELDVRVIIEQLLGALELIHSLRIVHLDIKPQNILLMKPFPSHHVKLCDFEISRRISHGQEIREILGTPDYVAPEVLELEPIGPYTDIWSLGVTTYVLLTGFSPFGGDTDSETFSNILDKKPIEFPIELFEDISQDAISFIELLVDKRYRVTRPSAKILKENPWIKQTSAQTNAPGSRNITAEETKPNHSSGMKRLSKSTLDLTHKSRERLYEKLKSSTQNSDKFKMSKSREQLWKSKVNIRESMEELSNLRVAKWVSMDNFTSKGSSQMAGSSGGSGSNHANDNENSVSVKDLIRNWTEQSMDIIMEENPDNQGVVCMCMSVELTFYGSRATDEDYTPTIGSVIIEVKKRKQDTQHCL
ncbi:unnamed protein product [Allacma fusca]|uniref:Protein kinase domain-containing protein n=1 Tax=Allacma fusca TaxID=39272 RepID=A0A8J2JS98_9HEXA|nr:unnamed protein product [Allacma fusca]